ncbi:MAG: DUF1614 domain-containing protein [Christensenellales bacterium]|jgi:hypothetical protein
MTIGLILLIITGLLIAFGVGQRALDRLRLTDAQAYVAIALIIGLGFVPEIPLGPVEVNLGGCVIPLALAVYLFIKADTAWERWRAIIASVVTGGAVWALMRYLPNEPENMRFDPNWIYGIAAAVIAYLLGRSRRCAFIGGVVGVLLAQTASVIPVWMAGTSQQLVLGGAGAFDTVVIAGFLGVLLAELVGEIVERAKRGSQRPRREFKDGDFVKEERHE